MGHFYICRRLFRKQIPGVALKTRTIFSKILDRTQINKNTKNTKTLVCTNYGAKTVCLSMPDKQVDNSKQDLKNMP